MSGVGYAAGGVAASWVVVAGALVAGGRRARRGPRRDRQRQRRQLVGAGLVAAAGVALVATVLHLLVDWPAQIAPVAVGAAVLVPVAMLAGGVGPIASASDRLLVQVLSAAGFAVLVSLIYIVVVLGLGKAPSGSTDREVLGLSMVAAAAAAIGYVPARERLMALATGLVYGAREAPDAVLRTFGSRMTRAITLDELLLQLAESLRKTLGLASAEIYTGSGEVLELAVSVPDATRAPVVVTDRERAVVAAAGVSGNAWASVWLPTVLDGRPEGPVRVAPVSHAGELLGMIVVVRGGTSSGFTAEDDLMLTELARQVGLALHNARLDTALQTTLDELRRQADELRASRARIVASGDAERRRVERNLHDGAQQHLVALAVNLRLARDVVKEDPTAAVAMLDELAVSVKETIQELRDLAHGIYPPLLVDSGLAEALRAAANRSPLDVSLVSNGIGRYPGDVEAAIYFCCLEALQNAGKYAPESSVEVHVWEDAGGLLFTVSDDGPGFDPELARGGQGFINMTDRLGAIGGSVRWDSEPGRGTVVRGSVPLG